jgi:hypothetical protein
MKMDDRHVYGPRPVGALVSRVTRPAFRRRAPATAQVLADWSDIVGPAIAAVTTPRRLSRNTLTIACSGPIAMELQHMAAEVSARINTHLGKQVVTALRFVQTLEMQPLSMAPPPPLPDPAKLAAIDASVSSVPPGELRDALSALGRTMAANAAPSTSRPPRR